MQTNTIELVFHFEKSTKGAHRYQEVDQGGHRLKPGEGATIGTLYVRKIAIGEDPPDTLSVTVSHEFKGDPA
jgi:hypothetical protein